MDLYICLGIAFIAVIVIVLIVWQSYQVDNLANLDRDIIANELVGTGLHTSNVDQSRTMRLLRDLEEPYY